MNGFDPAFFAHHCTRLSKTHQQSVRRLSDCCRAHDRISLSYPLLLEEGASDHYLILDSRGTVLSALALVPFDASTVECSAFTHPDHRRKGFFSRLLTLALDTLNERGVESDILFPVSGDCPDTLAALDALGAEFSGREYVMEQVLSNAFSWEEAPENLRYHILPPDNIFTPDALWSLFLTDANRHFPGFDLGSSSGLFDTYDLGPVPPNSFCLAAGSCLTSPVSSSCVCVHHVEIIPSLRRQGLGTRMIRLLCSHLYHAGITRVILQVSGDNLSALSLYKKTGFRITETLSYYLY